MPETKKSVKSLIPYEVPMFAEEYELKVDANENVFGCSDKVLDAIKNITKEQIATYPHYGNLTKKLAEYLNVDFEQIKVTNGADEALFALMQTYLDEGDKMLTVSPSFSMPKLYAEIVGGQVVEIPYEKRWEFPLDGILNAIETDKAVKIVHLTSPNNPTGECISTDIAKKILEKAKDKLVIFDETYGSYCENSMVSEVKNYDNLAVVKSFSKDFALAGLRIGYIITNPERVKILKTVISPYSVNTIAAIAAEAALSDLKHLEYVKKEVSKSKEILKNGLEKLGFTVFPSQANFVLFDAQNKAEWVYHTLLKNGIKIRKFSNMQGLIRITAPTCDNAKKIIELLQPQNTLIFDMDGVLVDVSNSYRTAVKLTYEHYAKKELNYETIAEAKALGGLNNDWDLTEYLLKKENINVDKQELIDVFEKFYFNDGKGLISQEKFLLNIDLLKDFSKKYNVAIFTGRPREEAMFTLNLHGIANCFYPIITMDDLPADKQKPNTLGIEKIKEKILFKDIFYFGDTKDDMICGTNANVIPVGILPPQDKTDNYKSHLEQNGAKFVLQDINELLTVTER